MFTLARCTRDCGRRRARYSRNSTALPHSSTIKPGDSENNRRGSSEKRDDHFPERYAYVYSFYTARHGSSSGGSVGGCLGGSMVPWPRARSPGCPGTAKDRCTDHFSSTSSLRRRSCRPVSRKPPNTTDRQLLQDGGRWCSAA
ncbi:uncharacterized protein LOC112639952 [Camponotus floridanus]|uniref:uncharacterized protein LOC112639952 n=1 Tax=Camponotus floridanus TaxID=104421 RepID=UPI000DC6CFA0|nr:uncharacterized protein LOC112639952 [Camponotus floridanus]